MSVKVNGSFLSALLFDQSCAYGDQEGLLLGKVVSRVTDTITDSDMNCIKEDVATYVQSHLPCVGLFSWYDDSGRIIQERLLKLLSGHSHKEVVGWYKWRRSSSSNVSLRERSIHRHLLEALPGVKPANFVFCLCVKGQSNSSSATHTFSHTFFSMNGRAFHGLPLTIVNLGDTVSSNYKTTQAHLARTAGSVYEKTMRRFHDHFVEGKTRMRNASGVRAMNAHLLSQLNDLCLNVNASERQVAELSAQVTALQKRARHRSQSTSRRHSENAYSTSAPQSPVFAAIVQPCGDTTSHALPPTPAETSPVFCRQDVLKCSLGRDVHSSQTADDPFGQATMTTICDAPASSSSRLDSVAARLFVSGNDGGFLATSTGDDVTLSTKFRQQGTSKMCSGDRTKQERCVPGRTNISVDVLSKVDDHQESKQQQQQQQKGGDAFSFVDDMIEKAVGGQTSKCDRYMLQQSKSRVSTRQSAHPNHELVPAHMNAISAPGSTAGEMDGTNNG